MREFLLEAAEDVPNLEIWVTGGWVRDRLLNIDSSDLDLALNCLTGKQFGIVLEQFSRRPDILSKYSEKASALNIAEPGAVKFTIIERNAEAAKQLETAHGRLFGLDIDLVNLRKEVYKENSRTPEMDFGSPEEDALRRDATVNALFLNLKSQQVVDLTRRGLDDLRAKRIRTPLEPFQTFMEDPLRVLRLIRIGSKLQFTIDTDTKDCMRNDVVQKALDNMITRDRINIEIFKMAKTSPAAAFQLLFECNLYVPIFLRFGSPLVETLQRYFPPQNGIPWPSRWPHTIQHLDGILKLDSQLGSMARSVDQPECLWILAVYTPLAKLRSSRLQAAVQEANDAVRLPVKIKRLLEAALKNFDAITSLVDSNAAEQSAPPRSEVGTAIRLWGATWPSQILYNLLARSNGFDSIAVATASEEAETDSLTARFSRFIEHIWDQNLQNAHIQAPFLNGNEIKQLFSLSSDGRYIKTAIEALIAWQFDHPQASKDDAKTWLLSQKDSFDIPGN